MIYIKDKNKVDTLNKLSKQYKKWHIEFYDKQLNSSIKHSFSFNSQKSFYKIFKLLMPILNKSINVCIDYKYKNRIFFNDLISFFKDENLSYYDKNVINFNTILDSENNIIQIIINDNNENSDKVYWLTYDLTNE